MRARLNDLALSGLAVWRMYVRAMAPILREHRISEETAALLFAVGSTEMKPKADVAWLSGLYDRRSLHAAIGRAGDLVKSGKRSVRLTDAGKALMDKLDIAVNDMKTTTVEELARRSGYVEQFRKDLLDEDHPAGEAAGVQGAATVVPAIAS